MEGIREKFLWRKAFLSKVVGYACHFKKKKSLYQHFSRISRILEIRKATFFLFFLNMVAISCTFQFTQN